MITGNEPINVIRGADNTLFWKSNPVDKDILEKSYTGLTIRQHFASMAMQGLMANTEKSPMTDDELCEFSVRISDKLIAELNKEKP